MREGASERPGRRNSGWCHGCCLDVPRTRRGGVEGGGGERAGWPVATRTRDRSVSSGDLVGTPRCTGHLSASRDGLIIRHRMVNPEAILGTPNLALCGRADRPHCHGGLWKWEAASGGKAVRRRIWMPRPAQVVAQSRLRSRSPIDIRPFLQKSHAGFSNSSRVASETSWISHSLVPDVASDTGFRVICRILS